MTQIALIDGIYSDEGADFRTSLPRNMIPVPKTQGISAGYLRPGDGLVKIGEGPGLDRGGIVWNGSPYRVMGGNLVRQSVDGVMTVLGTISGLDYACFDYSFDRLAIAAGGNLYYWNGSTLVTVGDTDLGIVRDVVWCDGYFMTTDGTSLIVTELTDPTSINPLKYGSSEADPDPIVALVKLRNEIYALNRYTIEQFNNVGGENFPFERNEGAQIQRGTVGTHCATAYMEALAFVGSGRNESPAIYLGINGSSQKISTREIDTILEDYNEHELSQTVLEVRAFKNHQLLYVHLMDQTLVYDAAGSQAVGQAVWFTLDSSVVGKSRYRGRTFLWAYDSWSCADPTSNLIARADDSVSTHYGASIGWELCTGIVYNEGSGAIFHQLELVGLPGRVTLGADPVVWTSYSIDGETWSQERACSAGKLGDRTRRLTWLRQGMMRNWRIQKFRGTSDAHFAVARLEVKLEPLNV